MKALDTVHNAARHAESQWFDRVRHVQTFGDVTLQQAGVPLERQADSHRYVPARAANIRSAIRAVPAGDLSCYTFVDLGAGKGRGLFVAAEFSFCRIVGVDVSPLLYQIACNNVASFRYYGLDAKRIVLLAQDATTFEFPKDHSSSKCSIRLALSRCDLFSTIWSRV